MPVSLLPLVTTAFLVGLPILALRKGQRRFLATLGACALVVCTIVLWIMAPGWLLLRRAKMGDRVAMYQAAQWTECYANAIGAILPFWGTADVIEGFRWLRQSADLHYPPALYALGVRYKYATFVPPNYGLSSYADGWEAHDSSVVQARLGQQYIEQALALGYRPDGEEKCWYWTQFRRLP